MTEEERRRLIRKKRKIARLRARRRKLIMCMVLCFLLVITVIAGITKCTAGGDDKKEGTKTEEQKDKKNNKDGKDDKDKKEENDKKGDEDQKEEEEQKKEDPRVTEFAVDPARPAGSDVESEEKVVYLTIDDGPSKITQQVLDVLDKYNAKATFFVTNHSSEYAHLIKEAHDRGHTIGMHTSSHDYNQVYSSVEAYFADLDAIAQSVKAQIGYIPCFIRFPGGSSNTVSSFNPGIMSTLVQEVQARGYQYYDWNASTGDGSVVSKEAVIANGTSAQNNNIVMLAHDSATKQSTVDGLPAIIEHYQSLGYTFKALDRSTIKAHHGVNN